MSFRLLFNVSTAAEPVTNFQSPTKLLSAAKLPMNLRLQLDVISRPTCAVPLNFHRLSVAGEPSTDLRLPLNVTTPAEPATNSQSSPDNIASQTLVQFPTSIECCISCLTCADTLNFLRKPRRDASPNSVRCIDSCQAGDETPTSTELCIVLLSRG